MRRRQLAVQVGEDRRGVVAGDHDRIPALRGEQTDDVGVVGPAEDRGPGDLVAVEVQDRQDRAVAARVEECGNLPRSGQRPGLGLPVTDDARHRQLRMVERGTRGVREGVAELTALVNAARHLHADVAGHPARGGELPYQGGQPVDALRDVRIHLAVGAFEIHVREQRRTAVPRTGDIDAVRPGVPNQPVEQRVDHRQAGAGPPVPEQARLDVVGGQRIAYEGIGFQVDLRDGQVVRRRPPAQVEVSIVLGVRRRRGHRFGQGVHRQLLLRA
jgi:hypothetical protein